MTGRNETMDICSIENMCELYSVESLLHICWRCLHEYGLFFLFTNEKSQAQRELCVHSIS